jgi:murein L,D-transpeptidase YafK
MRASLAYSIARTTALLLAGALACSAFATSLPDPVPTSDRSLAVTERITPRLIEELSRQSLLLGAPIYLRIFKEERELELWVESAEGYQLFRNYPICDVSGIVGPKVRQGDWQAPEGFYQVSARWMNPNSNFHLSFNIGYPNRYDRAQGRTGGNIMVHGGCESRGCFAMTDEAMEEIYVLAEAALRHSQRSFPVHVFPFRLTEANLARNAHRRWADFWETLKPAHDWFEAQGRPPEILVTGNGYRIEGLDAPERPDLVHFDPSPTSGGHGSETAETSAVSPR